MATFHETFISFTMKKEAMRTTNLNKSIGFVLFVENNERQTNRRANVLDYRSLLQENGFKRDNALFSRNGWGNSTCLAMRNYL